MNSLITKVFLCMASAGAGALGWSAVENRLDEQRCKADEWECPSHIPRTISERVFQYVGQEESRFADIIGQAAYDAFGMCDQAIATHFFVETARVRVAAEFANQFSDISGKNSFIAWQPPAADTLFLSFKNVADNRLGMHCGVGDPVFFADSAQYDAVLTDYAQGARFVYLQR